MVITQEKIKQVVDKIVKEFEPEKIILFGSYAWGEPDKDSDVDLFIIKETDKNIFERNREAQRIIFGSGIPIDVLVYTPKQLIRREKLGDQFVQEIINKGQIIYEQSAR
ncbi:MAG: nucleotidyltransferase domain-containing protein [Candidatus Brennerbacteria bacterium]|nr:nucleotidyltransferase domain-containing protein [Candidatus Brennerbacteria bacterium]